MISLAIDTVLLPQSTDKRKNNILNNIKDQLTEIDKRINFLLKDLK